MRILSDLTLGQYYPAASPVHRLDPRAKLLSTLVMMISLFSRKEWVVIITWSLAAFLAIRFSAVPERVVLRNLRPFFWLFVITFVIHLFAVQDRIGPRITIWGFSFYASGITEASFFGARLALFVVFSSLLTLTTSPLELTDALEKMLHPLRKLKVPVHEIAMMASLAMRFIPTIIDEADRLHKAQLLRGARFSGSLYRRLQTLVPMTLPLFLATFRRADDLAVAMQARCYDSRTTRTSYSQITWRLHDTILVGGVILLAVGVFGV